SSPTAVFWPPQTPGGFGQPASIAGESANQQSAIDRIKKPQRQGERPMGVNMCRVFIFGWIYCRVCPRVREPPSSSRGAWNRPKERPSSEECSHSFWLIRGSSCLHVARRGSPA